MKRAIVIGSSTGGPSALEELFKQLPADLPVPVLIAQHLTGPATVTLVERLNHINTLRVCAAHNNDILEPAHAYVIPGDSHCFLTAPGPRIALLPADDLPKPSVDMGFTSVAEHFGPDTVGVILSGMGSDGTIGAKAVKQLGGVILVQDEATSAIFGMPKRVIESGFFDEIVPLHRIAARLIALTSHLYAK
ncbi:MAG: two-component system, chemotaxis family, response regulator CheB [Candidatus Peregrinibacteria bacterium Greene0416_19]|nr:MAG: two-component system, chemotaxis family, response regulator CheB [Candidatus Peregrinibacteria bacterium Greene0416_19]